MKFFKRLVDWDALTVLAPVWLFIFLGTALVVSYKLGRPIFFRGVSRLYFSALVIQRLAGRCLALKKSAMLSNVR